jgi:uncharacterized lipoprotein YddW (UPF0748 family)
MKLLFGYGFVMLCVVIEAIAQTYPVAARDPKNVRDYPGGRGEHQLILYTPAYGKPTTGTNQWGVEAVVKDDIVIAIGGNNSPIRKGQFVLSGHGRARLFLTNSVRIGSKITVTDSAVFVSFDAESFRIYAKIRQDEVRKKFQMLESKFPSGERNILRAMIDSLTAIGSGPTDDPAARIDSNLYRRGMSRLNEAEYRISLSAPTEGRGVWHRPNEKNAGEIAALVKKFADAGFNMLFVESIWRGETIYPGFRTKQKKQFLGFDPLRTYIDEGKKHGVEIHAWIHTFFVGYVGASDDSGTGPILTAHPEWQLVKRNGEKVSAAEPGYLFVNPAHPDAQDFIASLYKEVRTLYPDLAGIQLDYIRYPVNIPLEESSDYSTLSRSEFKKVSGVDPLEIHPNEHPEQWEAWRLWRERVITDFVKRIRWENPEVLLSADIFPDIEEAHQTKMQNWGEWANRGYVNFLAPMAYTVNTEWVGEAITKMRSVVGEKYPLYVGLAPYLRLTPSMLLQQIEKCREMNVHGVVLFATSSLSDEQLHLLSIGPFRTKARPPQLINKNLLPKEIE